MCDFFRALWEANLHKKRTYGSRIMKFFSFKIHMGQLGCEVFYLTTGPEVIFNL